MYISRALFAAVAVASTAEAFSVSREAATIGQIAKRGIIDLGDLLGSLLGGSGTSKQAAQCPAVWKTISTTLTAQFLANGQCTDAARAAIRGAFHDCINGACDGSLILSSECSNLENRGLERLCTALTGVAKQNNVGYADLIQFSAAHAIKTCPGGPTVPVYVGRSDSSRASPQGVIPPASASANSAIQLFTSKGFSTIDLIALIGAHTVAKQRITDPSRVNASMDSTVGIWDNKFYSETKSGRAPFTLQSDSNLANSLLTSITFNTFALSKSAWDSAFVNAMSKMSLLGVTSRNLVECTSALPGGDRKRAIRNSNIWERWSS